MVAGKQIEREWRKYKGANSCFAPTRHGGYMHLECVNLKLRAGWTLICMHFALSVPKCERIGVPDYRLASKVLA